MYKNSNGNQRSLYQRIDDSLMRGANKAVKMWNWTTGGTKASLANTVLAAGEAICVINCFAGSSDFNRSSTLPYIFIIPLLMMGNKNQEKIESKAKESNALDANAEICKIAYKKAGPTFIVLGSIPIHNGPFSSTITLAGLSAYIMRADNLPKQKNAFARGWEKARELLRTPELQPAPVPVRYGSIIRSQ